MWKWYTTVLLFLQVAFAALGFSCCFADGFAQVVIRTRGVLVDFAGDADDGNAPANAPGGAVLGDALGVVAGNELPHFVVCVVFTGLRKGQNRGVKTRCSSSDESDGGESQPHAAQNKTFELVNLP